MSKYISAETLKAKIRKHLIPIVPDRYCDKCEEGENAGFCKALDIIASPQQEQPMPDSTKLIELWHKDKEMLKEKDLRNDQWRLAFNAFMCGFGRGLAVKQKQPELPGIEEPGIPGKDFIPVEWVEACERYGKWRIVKREQPEDIVVIAKTFLDAISKTPYNNKPITDAQIIVRQLLFFFENPKEYNPDAILEQPEVDLEKEYKTWWNSISGKINIEHMMEWYMHETARHFWNKGYNAGKEE